MFAAMGRLRHLYLFAAAAATLLLFPAAALAKHADKTPLNLPDDSSDGKTTSLDGGSMILRTLVGVAITVLIIYVIYRVMKAFKGRAHAAGRNPAIEVLSRTHADKDLIVYTIRSGDSVAVVGRTQHGIQIIERMSLTDAERHGLTKSVGSAPKQTMSQMWQGLLPKVKEAYLYARKGQKPQQAAQQMGQPVLISELERDS